MTTEAVASAWEYAAEHFSRPAWTPYPWQVPPADLPAHGVWLIEGGRGIGKTDGCAHYVLQHVAGPPCDPRVRGGHRIAIVGPTLDDAAESCVRGPSGLQAYDPSVRLITTLGGSKAVWPSGAEAKLFGANSPRDVDRLRAGGNRCLVWLEEAAAMPYLGDALQHARYGLRVGRTPHIVASSTPRPRPDYKALRSDPDTIRTTGTTDQAHHLDAAVRARLYADYAGTRLGRQELAGELLEDVEGALWALSWIDTHRVPADTVPDLARVVVSVDPAATSTDDADETGIVVIGRAGDHLYVLDDVSGRLTPAGWGDAACRAAVEWDADAVVFETNQGGEMVASTLRHAWRALSTSRRVTGPIPRLVPVHASKGKRVRAEPIAAVYEQGRAHHAAALPRLEDQLTTWVPGESDSPDRLDALVHGATELLGTRRTLIVR